MLDMLLLRTSQAINESFLEKQLETNFRLQYMCNIKGYRRFFYLKYPDRSPSPFKLFCNKSSNAFDGLINAIEINPSHFKSELNVYHLLDQLFIDFAPELFKVSRIDFAVDVEGPFHYFLQRVFRSRIKHHQTFYERGEISSVVFGNAPIQAKIYNKSLQLSQRASKVSRLRAKDKPKPITRFEVKIQRRSNKKFPIQTLIDLSELLDFNPFPIFKFNEVDPNQEDVKSIVQDTRFGGMHVARKAVGRELQLKSSHQYKRFFNGFRAPDLFQVHRQQLHEFLNPVEFVSQDLGGILV